MARKKRESETAPQAADPEPHVTRFLAITVKVVADQFANAMVIWTTPDGVTRWLSAPQSHIVERGMIETVLEEMKPKRVLTEE